MRAVIQRVTSAKVEVEGKVTGEIEKGFLILFGVGQEDTEADCDKLADKISKLRIFADENDKSFYKRCWRRYSLRFTVHPLCRLSPRQPPVIYLCRQA